MKLFGRLRRATPKTRATTLCEHGIPVAECDQRDEHATIRALDARTIRPHPGAASWGKP